MLYNGSSSDRFQTTVRFVSHRVFLLVLIFLAILILLLGRADSKALNSLRNQTAEAFTGLFEAFSVPVASAINWIDGVNHFWLVYEENERLRAENKRLMQWKALAEKLQGTVSRYNALLNVNLDPAVTFATGRAVADGGSPFVRTLIVNVGQEQGVAKGQAVINERGLVGWVVGASAHAARVLLVTDLNSRIPVKIGEEGQRAILIGDNSGQPRIEFLMATGTVEPGEPVMTSGDDGVLPPGLPVGTVAGRDGKGAYRVRWHAGEGPIDFIRVLQFGFPRDVDAVQQPVPLLEEDEAEPAVPEDPVGLSAEDEAVSAAAADGEG